MTIFDAYLGGVQSMFSVWIFCLLQVVPYFIAFAVGAQLTGDPAASLKKRLPVLIPAIILPFVGFTMVFVFMGMTTTAVSKMIFKALGPANDFGGVAIALVALHFAGAIKLAKTGSTKAVMKAGMSLFFGMALAFAYKPCVTPTLTKIYLVSSAAQTSMSGGVLLFFYSFGIFSVVSVYSLALSWVADQIPRAATFVRMTCAALLFMISALILSGNMTHYKSFLVGRFVSHDQMEHKNEKMEHPNKATGEKEKRMDHSHGDMK